jgi:hypothetical protein
VVGVGEEDEPEPKLEFPEPKLELPKLELPELELELPKALLAGVPTFPVLPLTVLISLSGS